MFGIDLSVLESYSHPLLDHIKWKGMEYHTYLQNYDSFKRYIDNNFEMPDRMVSLLLRFLEQNNGMLSNKAIKKEFSGLKHEEIKGIEENYYNIFIK
mgnify:CR=1 FL=1